MQDEILAAYPEADLSVYAIWLPILPGDRRSAWDPDLMPDPRVKHFWDGDREVGFWFAENHEGVPGIAWDIYFLYGPDAHWEGVPEPLVSSGFTVIGSKDRLHSDMMPLLEN